MKDDAYTLPTQPALAEQGSLHELALPIAAATSASEREHAVRRTGDAWQELRSSAEARGWRVERLPTPDAVRAALTRAARESDRAARETAVGAISHGLDRARAALSAEGPRSPAQQWAPTRAPLGATAQRERLQRAAAESRGSARTLVDAVRRVVAARRDHGVSLHETYTDQAGQRMASLAVAMSAGYVEPLPIDPIATSARAPWGVFEVQTALSQGDLADHVALSPPLPAWGDLLDARYARARFADTPRLVPDSEDDSHA